MFLSLFIPKKTYTFAATSAAILFCLCSNIASLRAQEICFQPLTGGTIFADTTSFVIPFQPPAIQNIHLASNVYTVEYLWMKTSDQGALNGLNSNFDLIPNSNSSTYMPVPIVQTTWYRRLARHAGCSDYVAESNWARITIDENATPAIVAPTQIFVGQSATLTTAGGTAYRWNTGQTTPNIVVTPKATTTYTVTVTTQNGQNVTLNKTVFVLRGGNTVAHDLDNNTTTNAARTVLNTTNTTNTTIKQGFGLSPNPNATNTLTVKWAVAQSDKVSIRMTDMTGKTIQNTVVNAENGENTQQLSIDNLLAGVYFVQIMGENEHFVAQRFVKL